LREITSSVATWATFTDISLHGCYVEAMFTFPVRRAARRHHRGKRIPRRDQRRGSSSL